MLNCIDLLYGVRARIAGTFVVDVGPTTSARKVIPSRVSSRGFGRSGSDGSLISES